MDVLSQKVQELMKELEPKFIEDLHWFHENPEMSFKEFDTTAYIRKELEA